MPSSGSFLIAVISFLFWTTALGSTDAAQHGESVFCGNQECTKSIRLGSLIRGFNFADTFLPEGTDVDILGEHALHPNILLVRHGDQTFYLDSSLVRQGETLVPSFYRTVLPRVPLQPESSESPESAAGGKPASTLPEHASSRGTASSQQVKTDNVLSSSPLPASPEEPTVLQAQSNSPSKQPSRPSTELVHEPEQHASPPKQAMPEAAADKKSNQQTQAVKSNAEDTVKVSASTSKSAKDAQESAGPSPTSAVQEPVSNEKLSDDANLVSLPSQPPIEPTKQPEVQKEKLELPGSPKDAPGDIRDDGSHTGTQPRLSAAQNQPPAGKEIEKKDKPLQQKAVVAEERHVESVPKEPLPTEILVDPVVAHETVSKHPEPANHLPVETGANVGQLRSVEETERPPSPPEAEPSGKKSLPTAENKSLHEDALASAAVESQVSEPLSSGYMPASSNDQEIPPSSTTSQKPPDNVASKDLATVSDTSEPSSESAKLEMSDQKTEEKSPTAELKENSKLRPSSPPPVKEPSSEDFKALEEPTVAVVSEAPVDSDRAVPVPPPGKRFSSEPTEFKPPGTLPHPVSLEGKDPDSSHISETNEALSSFKPESSPEDSSPHTTAPTVIPPRYEDPKNAEVSSGGEPPLEGPANSNSGHPQGPTPDEDLPSSTPPEVSPDSLHLSHLSGNLIKPSGSSPRRLIYSGFIQCLFQSANRSLPANLVASKSALSSLILFLFDNFITLAERAITFLSPDRVKMADDFLYNIIGVPLSFLVAWWFFLFSAFATYVLIRVGAHIFIGSGDVGGVQQRTLADWLAIEEHANQLAARLADQEEANARLTIWTMELSARCEDQMRSQSNTESSCQAQLREVRSALNQSRLETKELQATHDALVQQISSMKCDRASLEERLQAASTRYEAAENDWRLSRDELDQSHNAQVQALQEEKEELLTRSNTYRERIVEMETAMKELTTSSQKLEEELVARDRELAGLRDMFIQLKSFELSLSQTNADAASLGAATPPNVPKEDGARRKLSASSGGSAQDAADGSDWGAEVDELANEVDLDDQLAVTEMTSSRESDENETQGRQNERLQQVLANFLDVGKLRAALSALEDQLKVETDRCKQETELRSQLQEKLAALEELNATLMQKCSQAEEDRSAAIKKLEILSDYFKEREVVMQRDLGRQALSESETNDELDYLRQRAKSLDVEVKALREQVSSTRRELVENERASRRQIAQLDKRLHENWLSARASENLVKELRDENTALRQKIGDGEKRTLQQLISRGPPVPMPLLHQPLVPPGGSKKPDSRPSSRQLGNSTAQMPLKQGSGSRHTPSFLPPPPSLPGMPPFTAGAPGVPFMPPPPPPPPPGLIPPKGGLTLLPSVQRTFSNRNSPILPGWEVMHAPASPPAAPHSNSGSSRSAKR